MDPLLIVLLTILIISTGECWNCSPCKCIINENEEKQADCSFATINQKLNSIPSGVDTQVKILNFTGQYFTTLNRSTFEKYKDLKQIIFKNNTIKDINETVFFNMVQLEIIDFSYNKLNTLVIQNLQNLKNITAIQLDNNPWICDGRLRDIRLFFVWKQKADNRHMPKCVFPLGIKGRTWKQLENYTLTIKVTNSYVIEGDFVELTCQYTGAREYDIQWTPENSNLSTLWDDNYNRFYSRLKFERITKSNEKLYSCRIPGLNSTADIFLEVNKFEENHVHIRVITLLIIIIGISGLIGFNYRHIIIIQLHKKISLINDKKNLLIQNVPNSECEENIELCAR